MDREAVRTLRDLVEQEIRRLRKTDSVFHPLTPRWQRIDDLTRALRWLDEVADAAA